MNRKTFIKGLPKIDGNFYNKDIISISQFDTNSLDHLFEITDKMKFIAKNALSSDMLKGNIATLLFYEASSRTRGSFDAAIKQLGGQTIVVENPQQFSSVSKGETFEDTIKVFESYSDVIILRHPEVGSADLAAREAKLVPVINAGDGIGEHPTQALLDMATIKEKCGRLNNLIGVFGGDIKNGRTIHSLLRGLSLYPGNTIYLLSPDQLKLDRKDFNEFQKKGLKLIEIDSMSQIPKKSDFWYWTRVQKERFSDLKDYEKLNNKFVITKEVFDKYATQKTILLHPLPRVGEIDTNVDADPRAEYLRAQVRNGMYVRMALISLVLGKIK